MFVSLSVHAYNLLSGIVDVNDNFIAIIKHCMMMGHSIATEFLKV